MYKGFQLELIKEDFYSDKVFNTFYGIGKTYTSVQKNNIKKTIDSYLFSNGTLNGSNMQENWFPQIKADIFISHSHKDEELALTLAGWLKETFGLTAFIDSCVWGYSNDLLKLIDDVYCRNINRNSYDYDKRNYSTSHVHMMLSVALTQMIDNTECLFFLNTPNSITPDTIINQTESPWIYSEIAMSRLIRKKELKEKVKAAFTEKQKLYEATLGESFATAEKKITDGFSLTSPSELYNTYEAYSSTPIPSKRAGNVMQASKSVTQYYQPIANRDFDVVLNPIIVEPMIQVVYEMKMSVNHPDKNKAKEALLLTPAGELKKINLP